jgi:hypothetical protein
MSKTVIIHQPDFLSYLGFFHRFLLANAWVVLDNVQFVTGTTKSWQNRDKIKTAQGEKWITVSVQKAPLGTLIKDILLSASDWRRDNLNLIRNSYVKAPYYTEIIPYIEDLYAYECSRLVEFNLKSSEMLMELLGVSIDMVLASELQPTGKSNELLVDILKKVGGDTYLSGIGARSYFTPEPFDEARITVIWQDFKHPIYPQLFGEFIPYLSSIDLLFNCGIDTSRKILANTQDQ